MGHFTKGLLVGVGISLLIAPRTGEEMRRLLAERFRYLRGIPPENAELKQAVQEMSKQVESVQEKAMHAAEMGSRVQDLAQQTEMDVASVQSDLSKVAQQAGTDGPQATPGDMSPTRPLRPPRLTP
jgi:gas vesicle protein